MTNIFRHLFLLLLLNSSLHLNAAPVPRKLNKRFSAFYEAITDQHLRIFERTIYNAEDHIVVSVPENENKEKLELLIGVEHAESVLKNTKPLKDFRCAEEKFSLFRLSTDLLNDKRTLETNFSTLPHIFRSYENSDQSSWHVAATGLVHFIANGKSAEKALESFLGENGFTICEKRWIGALGVLYDAMSDFNRPLEEFYELQSTIRESEKSMRAITMQIDLHYF